MLNVRELNALSSEEFTRLIGPVFEHSSWIAEKTWSQQPFANRDHLHQVLCQTVIAGDDQSKVKLIRAHPDLAGRVELTDASSSEQASANLTQLSQEEMNSFQKYNRLYREKFGFPFVICARLNKKEAILAAFPIRLQNSPDEEKETALDEIFKIAELRLREIVQ
jgi:2-oxo-4-hydroxy-4-carboxy-5-ureidoimidazoline decarboxylase